MWIYSTCIIIFLFIICILYIIVYAIIILSLYFHHAEKNLLNPRKKMTRLLQEAKAMLTLVSLALHLRFICHVSQTCPFVLVYLCFKRTDQKSFSIHSSSSKIFEAAHIRRFSSQQNSQQSGKSWSALNQHPSVHGTCGWQVRLWYRRCQTNKDVLLNRRITLRWGWRWQNDIF